MTSMNTRLNIEKIDGNIIQKHGGSKQVGLKQLSSKQVRFKKVGVKQVGFKQLGPGVEIGVHGVQDEKRGAQGNHETEDFQVSNDDAAVAQRRFQEGAEGNVAERYKGDSNMVAVGVARVIEEYAHESLNFRDAVACEIIWGLLAKVRLRYRFSNGMSVQILLGGHSTLSLEGGLSGNRDEQKKSKGSCVYDTYWKIKGGYMAKGILCRVTI
ncbi:hypothetical protein Tco_0746080 [Tanacetum coccineum]